MRKQCAAALLAACAGLALAPVALGQMHTPPSEPVKWRSDSGPVAAAGGGAAEGQVVYQTTVFVPNATWLRLQFSAVELAGRIEEGTGAYLRITSLIDGGTQYLNAESAKQWSNTSAYFNGDAVSVELIAFPGTGPSRVAISGATAGLPETGSPDSICGVDDRQLSFDNRQARHSVGCTSWLINDTNSQFLTAGHCGASGSSVMSFNVPLSNPNGSLVQSAPQDQYVVDGTSVQGANGGIGNDWMYFGVVPNSNTGLMPTQAYNQGTYILQLPPALAAGQDIRITGYGTTSSPVSPTWNQAQKTHNGPRVAPNTGAAGTTLAYQVDTTGGNSGSPVVWENGSGVAIGIHTHAGCSAVNGNKGTGLNHPNAQNALNNPQGVCRIGRGTPTGSLYATGDTVNNFGTCDTATGAFAKITFTPPRMEGLAFHPNSGLFYGVNNDTYGVAPGPAGRKLFTIDPTTGATTYIANISGAAGIINGLGYDPVNNVLYGVIQATGTLVLIDTTTGAATVAGTANPGTTIGALEFNTADGLLYGIDDSGGASKLVRFGPSTGAAAVIGPLGAGIADCNGLAITETGEFYTINAANEQLLRINPATGAATVVGPTGSLFGASYGMSAVLPNLGGCYANCDNSTVPPILNVNDFVCFQQRFSAGNSYANCDGSTTPPILNVNDFVCFQQLFSTGCP